MYHNIFTNREEVFAAFVASSLAVTVTVTASQPLKKKIKWNPQRTFRRAALNLLVCAHHTIAWGQVISCERFSSFLLCTNVHRDQFSTPLCLQLRR